MLRNRYLGFLLGLGVAALLVYGWHLLAEFRIVSPVYLPSPEASWDALVKGLVAGDLGAKVVGTIEHMIYGWLLASLFGVALGAWIGSSPKIRPYLNPTLEFFRPLPASAMFPVAMAFLGLSNRMVLAVIALGALWPTLLSTVHGFASVESRLTELSRILGMGRLSVVFKISLPSAIPDILAGMRISITVALVLSVIGEIMASVDGLGLWVLLSARGFHSADLFAGVILLGLIGYVSSQMLNVVGRLLLRRQGL